MDIGTRLFTALRGRLVGTDQDGNRYFEDKRATRPGRRSRRWVAYAGTVEATDVPPCWDAWLHHTTANPLPEGPTRPWMRPHVANATGTASSWRPPGHDYRGGHRSPATGDYEAWTPGS